MRRRKFLGVLGGAAAAWPLAAYAQQSDVRRVGILMSTRETDPGEISSVTGIINVLENSGWVVGRNLAIDYRWAAGDPRRMQEYALELVALAPDVIFVGCGTDN